jgi:hypothetical protein
MLKLRPELAKLSLPENGHTACTTVFSHSPEMVRLLLENGADPKGIWPHRDATPPFILAKDRGYEDIAQVFLEDESVEIQPPEEFLAVVHDESATLAFLEGHTEYIRVPFYRIALLYTAAAGSGPKSSTGCSIPSNIGGARSSISCSTSGSIPTSGIDPAPKKSDIPGALR